MWQRRNWNH